MTIIDVWATEMLNVIIEQCATMVIDTVGIHAFIGKLGKKFVNLEECRSFNYSVTIYA